MGLETCHEAADLIERQSRDIAALMADNAEQVRIASEAVRSAIGTRNLCRVQAYELRGVIQKVELGRPFDAMSLEIMKRACAALEGNRDGC
jgi:hypothetical protein